MAVIIVQGDLFASPMQTLVNPVNCMGVMGAGLALAFKERFPAMYADYRRRCLAHQLHLGAPYLYPLPTLPWVLNFPTKHHWRNRSHLDDILQGMDYLASHYAAWGITSLALPALGCGRGGLDWDVVGPLLLARCAAFAIPIEVYAPFNPHHPSGLTAVPS